MSRARPLVLSLALLLLAASVVVDRQYLAPIRRETETLRAELARLEATVRRTRHQLTQTEREHAELESQAATTRAATAAAEAASAMKLWAGRITLLKRLLEEMPSESIPELRLLSATDWIQHIRTRELDTPASIRTALATLRAAARRQFAGVLKEALGRFIAQSKGELPSDIRHLAAYLTPPADLEMLQRYSLLRTGRSGDARELLIRESAPGDLILSVGLEMVHFANNPAWRPPGDENEAATAGRAMAAIDTALADTESNPEKGSLTLFAFKEFIEKFDPQLDTAFEGDFNAELKRAVKRFAADRAGAMPAHFADVLPFLSRRDQFAVIVRPLFAELDYMRDHHGQRATDPAQLRRYLERPLDQIKLMREFKLIVAGDAVSINLDISARSSDGPSP